MNDPSNPDPFEESELVLMFQEMDTDGGGHVCFAEFANQWAADKQRDAEGDH